MDKQELQKKLSHFHIPKADDNTKAAHINNAVNIFAQKKNQENVKNTKGNGISNRLIAIINKIGDETMNKFKKPIIISSLAATCAIVLVLKSDLTKEMPESVKIAVEDNQAVIKKEKTLPKQRIEITPTKPMTVDITEAVNEADISATIIAPAPKGAGRALEEQAFTSEIMPAQPLVLPQKMMAPLNSGQLGMVMQQDNIQMMKRAAPSIAVGEMHPHIMPYPPMETDSEQYTDFKQNDFKIAEKEPVSTFSSDVDTSSYTVTRRDLRNGVKPNKNSVRVEEFVNYFNYKYELPTDKLEPFKPTTIVYPSPWNSDAKLLHIGIKGYDIPQTEKPHSNLVFLLDVSGSMNNANKLPLVKRSLKLVLNGLHDDDTIGIVVYAGAAGTVLEPTKVKDKHKIIEALDKLHAGGSTAGEQGIRQAYNLAQQNFDENGVNRVILATDGDFNVGINNRNELKKFIAEKRETGIFLSVLGFGSGNYNDNIMQALAQNGNGNAAYIDSFQEAQKVLVDEAGSTLFTIAKDVKFQVEFNPSTVSEYRLIGYETRHLNREDFNNDKIDAGDIGSGHSVTAIYEMLPTGKSSSSVDPLRYNKVEENKPNIELSEFNNEYAFVKIRYKLPNGDVSKLITKSVSNADELEDINNASNDIRFAASVAGFAQLLKDNNNLKDFSYDDVLKLAGESRGKDQYGYRSEFLQLVKMAKSLNQ